MKKIICLLCLFIHFNLSAQSYLPLHIDSTSIWVYDYRTYFAGECIQGEKTTQVFGDTIIAGMQYFQLETFATIPPIIINPLYLGYYYLKDTQFIREDTLLKQVFEYKDGGIGDMLALDYNLNIGDSMPMISYQPLYNLIVDSINLQAVLGTTRKIQHSHLGTVLQNYKTIEGIGASHNFPANGHGEWGIPFYTLKCYSKNGVQLYGDITIPCIKSFPVLIEESMMQDIKCKIQNRSIFIENISLENLDIKLYNLNGDIVSKEISNNAWINRTFNTLPTGIYILKINSSKSNFTQKINFE